VARRKKKRREKEEDILSNSIEEMAERRITLANFDEVIALCGMRDENLRFIERKLGAQVFARGNEIIIRGEDEAVEKTASLVEKLAEMVRAGEIIGAADLKYAIEEWTEEGEGIHEEFLRERIEVYSKRRYIVPKTPGQRRYVEAIREYDIVFAIGPAGTGKTYLAMAMAVSALKSKQVSRIILTRPAIEAGEKLGFLPGTLEDKVSPYLRPLYDALYDMMEVDRIQAYLERGIIEIAPLAYMRGRTLNDSFIVLDEAQNTTSDQMKMFLTRLGFDSKAVITGDITQSDLPPDRVSGLVEVQDILRDIEGIKFVYFDGRDVVRHHLVQKIIEAYDSYKTRTRGGTETATEEGQGEN